MCGRYTSTIDPQTLRHTFGATPPPEYRPRYNIAPQQQALVLLADDDGEPVARMLRWGLVPFWAKDERIGSRMINSRAETVAEKPAYRNAFSKRRCLVVADGFYEWQPTPAGKQPHWIHGHDGAAFTFAGLWERWDRGPRPLETFSILTCAANEMMRPIHDRMPVILDDDAREAWLAPETAADVLLPLLVACPDDRLAHHPVSTRVNRPAHDDPICIEPLDEPLLEL